MPEALRETRVRRRAQRDLWRWGNALILTPPIRKPEAWRVLLSSP